MATWAELTAALKLDSRQFQTGIDGAVRKVDGMESRMRQASQGIGKMRGAMSSMASVAGATTGPLGQVLGSVQNIASAFAVNPIVGWAAAGVAAVSFLAGRVERDASRVLDAAGKINEVWNKAQAIRRSAGILVSADESTKSRTGMLAEKEDLQLLYREREIIRSQMADLGNVATQAELDRLSALEMQLKVYDETIAKVEAAQEARAKAIDQDRKAAYEAGQQQDEAVKRLRLQQGLVGKTAVEQARIRLAAAQQDEASAGTLIEREQARLAVMQAQNDVLQESLAAREDGMDAMEDKADKANKATAPDVERLVQMGAILRAPAANVGPSNLAKQQLAETRKQTVVLERIARDQGGF